MEMKEIIIDGVNVAGCNFRLERDGKQKCECCHATGFGVICDCEMWKNCPFKQLQRKKEEIEVQKYALEAAIKEISKLKSQEIHIKKSEQTLQEIKNFLELPEFYLYGKETIHDRILQKITKAEVGE